MERRYLIRLVIVAGLVILVSGCAKNDSLVDKVSIPQAPEGMSLTPATLEYPGTPEDVVMAFLNTYPINPTLAIKFLAPKYVQSLDENSALALLPVEGMFDGFVIENGNTSAEDGKSMILAQMIYGKTEFRLIFLLIIEGGYWQIEAILQ